MSDLESLRFRLLGPVEATAAGRPLRLARRQERALLAVLLLQPGRVVPVPRLCDLVWDGDAPPGAARKLHTPVARIRRAFAAAGFPEVLVTHGYGYSLCVDDAAVDAHRFRRLIRRAYETDDPATGRSLLREALDMWQGPALHDAVGDRARTVLCADLELLRSTATEDLLAAELRAGRHREALPELARSVAEQPASERLAELYMRALHRIGRTADALRAYARIRAHLADELGLDPGAGLQRLQVAILREEPV